jgi:hypothetical protein
LGGSSFPRELSLRSLEARRGRRKEGGRRRGCTDSCKEKQNTINEESENVSKSVGYETVHLVYGRVERAQFYLTRTSVGERRRRRTGRTCSAFPAIMCGSAFCHSSGTTASFSVYTMILNVPAHPQSACQSHSMGIGRTLLIDRRQESYTRRDLSNDILNVLLDLLRRLLRLRRFRC